MSEAFSFAGNFSTQLSKFIHDNKASLAEETSQSFATRLREVRGASEAAEAHIQAINDEIASDFDDKTRAYRARVELKIKDVQSEIDALGAAATTETKLKHRTLKEELAMYKLRQLDDALVSLTKQSEADGLTPAERKGLQALRDSLKAVRRKKSELQRTSEKLKREQEAQQAS